MTNKSQKAVRREGQGSDVGPAAKRQKAAALLPAASKFKPFDAALIVAPEALVGLPVRVWWPRDNAFYTGRIVSFDAATQRHKVLYEDGDKEDLLLAVEQVQFAPPQMVGLPAPSSTQLTQLGLLLKQQSVELQTQILQIEEGAGRKRADPELQRQAGLCAKRAEQLLTTAEEAAVLEAATAAAAAQTDRVTELDITRADGATIVTLKPGASALPSELQSLVKQLGPLQTISEACIPAPCPVLHAARQFLAMLVKPPHHMARVKGQPSVKATVQNQAVAAISIKAAAHNQSVAAVGIKVAVHDQAVAAVTAAVAVEGTGPAAAEVGEMVGAVAAPAPTAEAAAEMAAEAGGTACTPAALQPSAVDLLKEKKSHKKQVKRPRKSQLLEEQVSPQAVQVADVRQPVLVPKLGHQEQQLLHAYAHFQQHKQTFMQSRELRVCYWFESSTLIHRQLRVYWEAEDAWFLGEVTAYDPPSGMHRVEYADGDAEWVHFGVEAVRLEMHAGELLNPLGYAALAAQAAGMMAAAAALEATAKDGKAAGAPWPSEAKERRSLAADLRQETAKMAAVALASYQLKQQQHELQGQQPYQGDEKQQQQKQARQQELQGQQQHQGDQKQEQQKQARQQELQAQQQQPAQQQQQQQQQPRRPSIAVTQPLESTADGMSLSVGLESSSLALSPTDPSAADELPGTRPVFPPHPHADTSKARGQTNAAASAMDITAMEAAAAAEAVTDMMIAPAQILTGSSAAEHAADSLLAFDTHATSLAQAPSERAVSAAAASVVADAAVTAGASDAAPDLTAPEASSREASAEQASAAVPSTVIESVQVLSPGEVVWGLVKGWHPWPAIVCTSEEGDRWQLPSGGKKPAIAVTFFGDHTRYRLKVATGVVAFEAGVRLGYCTPAGVSNRRHMTLQRALFEVRTYLTEGELPGSMLLNDNDSDYEDDEEGNADIGQENASTPTPAAGSGHKRGNPPKSALSAAAKGAAGKEAKLFAVAGAARSAQSARAIIAGNSMPLRLSSHLTVQCLGRVEWLDPRFHNEACIFPIGYKATRLAKTGASMGKDIPVVLEVLAAESEGADGGPVFRITPHGSTPVEGSTPTAALAALWVGFKEGIATSKARSLQGSGVKFFGLTHPHVSQLIQNLPDAERCERFSNWHDGEKPAVPELSQTDKLRRLALAARSQKLPEGVLAVERGVSAREASACDCEVCGEDVEYDGDHLLTCSSCRLIVHQSCYGVQEPPDGRLWLCDICQLRPFGLSRPPPCVLCPVNGGPMKQTTDGRWAHVVCAIWTPETGFENAECMGPIEGVDKLSAARRKLLCMLCKQPHGACVQCCGDRSCYTSCHVLCARDAGWALVSHDEDEGLPGCCSPMSGGCMSPDRFRASPVGCIGSPLKAPRPLGHAKHTGKKSAGACSGGGTALGGTLVGDVRLMVFCPKHSAASQKAGYDQLWRGRGGLVLGGTDAAAAVAPAATAKVTQSGRSSHAPAAAQMSTTTCATAVATATAPAPCKFHNRYGAARCIPFGNRLSRGHRAPDAEDVMVSKRLYVRATPYLVGGLRQSTGQLPESRCYRAASRADAACHATTAGSRPHADPSASHHMQPIDSTAAPPTTPMSAAAATPHGTATLTTASAVSSSSYQKAPVLTKAQSVCPSAAVTATVATHHASLSSRPPHHLLLSHISTMPVSSCADASWLADHADMVNGRSIRAPGLIAGADPHAPDVRSMGQRYMDMRQTLTARLTCGKSAIHGCGAFSKLPHRAGDMVIEYAGDLIRPSVADARELRCYDNMVGAGTYIFRLNDSFNVDATRAGNMAHLLNHSCEPNCYSRTISVREMGPGIAEGMGQLRDHVIIFAKRDIGVYEELTYDYRFCGDERLPCNCGAAACRGMVNVEIKSDEAATSFVVPRSSVVLHRRA